MVLHAKRTSGHPSLNVRSISVLSPTQLWGISLLPSGGSVSILAPAYAADSPVVSAQLNTTHT